MILDITTMTLIYCLKCKKKVEAAVTKTKVGNRDAVTGKCPVCGTKVFKFGSA